MPRLHNLRFGSEFEWNEDGKIHTYRAIRCLHGNHMIIDAPDRQAVHQQGDAKSHIQWDFCMRCNGPICLKCAAEMARTGECIAFERALLRAEGAERIGDLGPMRERAMLLNLVEHTPPQ